MKLLFTRHVALLVLLGSAACASGAGSSRIEAPVRRAALARITVDNRTDLRLAIAFRSAAGPSGEVIVGGVDPQSTNVVAPVVAGEPIVLLARTATGTELRLPPRTFEAGAEWTWTIPGDASFEAPAGGGA